MSGNRPAGVTLRARKAYDLCQGDGGSRRDALKIVPCDYPALNSLDPIPAGRPIAASSSTTISIISSMRAAMSGVSSGPRSRLEGCTPMTVTWAGEASSSRSSASTSCRPSWCGEDLVRKTAGISSSVSRTTVPGGLGVYGVDKDQVSAGDDVEQVHPAGPSVEDFDPLRNLVALLQRLHHANTDPLVGEEDVAGAEYENVG